MSGGYVGTIAAPADGTGELVKLIPDPLADRGRDEADDEDH